MNPSHYRSLATVTGGFVFVDSFIDLFFRKMYTFGAV